MPSDHLTIRHATVEDCAVILHHRRSMFLDMGEGTPDQLHAMAEVNQSWLAEALADGSYQGWLAQDPSGKVVAGGGVCILKWPASPRDPYTRRALIVNVYTEPEFRRRGLARQIMAVILEWLKENGFRSAMLHASDDGRPLYESLGFRPTNEMRLRF